MKNQSFKIFFINTNGDNVDKVINANSTKEAEELLKLENIVLEIIQTIPLNKRYNNE